MLVHGAGLNSDYTNITDQLSQTHSGNQWTEHWFESHLVTLHNRVVLHDAFPLQARTSMIDLAASIPTDNLANLEQATILFSAMLDVPKEVTLDSQVGAEVVRQLIQVRDSSA